MKSDQSILQRLAEGMDLAGEPLPGQSVVELTGGNRVLIENHSGVKEYGSTLIRVKVRFGSICVCGCNLELAKMTKGQLIISGQIEAVQLCRG